MALGTRGRPPRILRALPSLIDRIGSTSLVQLQRLPDASGARVFAKLEQYNPAEA